MKITKILLSLCVMIGLVLLCVKFSNNNDRSLANKKVPVKKEIKEKKKKTLADRARFTEERFLYEYNLQANPSTGKIPFEEKEKEKTDSYEHLLKAKSAKISSNTSYISRGPSNLGGRTRSLVIDKTDATSNTIIAGGVSSGVFRTTDGGASWTKVSPNDQIHNVTTIAQDPRTGFENIWYYGTGEAIGNSADASGAGFLGQGIWKSENSGLSWLQMPSTASTQEINDSPFDKIIKIQVHPMTGDLYAATLGEIWRFDGNNWELELDAGGNFFSDLVITSTGITYACFSGSAGTSTNGVWRSNTGIGSWNRIGSNTSPGFNSTGRMVMAIAPSNENILYVLHAANNANIEAGLWRWDNSNGGSWIDYSSRMPDEPNGDLEGNDPIAIQGGYDLVVSVKPDNANFVVIGGTNAYKIENIITQASFTRIGGYRNNQTYALYDLGGGDTHHPDIHALVFDNQDSSVLYSGTDGGIHKADVTQTTVSWTSLNNNYQTYQYYHVAIDPNPGSTIVIGGAQDNGTTAGGFSDSPDLTTMSSVSGGDGVAVAISDDNDCLPFFFGSQNGRIVRDCPNGQEITPTGSLSRFVTYFYLDPSNNNILYYAGRENLYRTNESSSVTPDSWTNLGTLFNASGVSGEEIRHLSSSWGIYTPNSYVLVGGSRGSVIRINNPQSTNVFALGRNITPSLARSQQGTVTGLAIHPTNPDIVLLTYSNYGITNIYITNNATSATPTWEVAERNLEAFSIRSAAITEVDGETIYFVGTARGLYSSTDPVNEDWTIEAPDQIGFAVVSSLAYRPADNQLLVGTHGNGMYIGTVAPTLSVDEFDTSDSSFVAYPIPASTEINIVVEESFVSGDLKYQVVDLNGRVVRKGTLPDNKKVNVDGLRTGAYVLKLDSRQRSKAITFIKK